MFALGIFFLSSFVQCCHFILEQVSSSYICNGCSLRTHVVCVCSLLMTNCQRSVIQLRMHFPSKQQELTHRLFGSARLHVTRGLCHLNFLQPEGADSLRPSKEILPSVTRTQPLLDICALAKGLLNSLLFRKLFEYHRVFMTHVQVPEAFPESKPISYSKRYKVRFILLSQTAHN